MTFFPKDAPSANPVFFRTYSRSTDGQRESFDDVNGRTVSGVAELGKLTEGETELISQMQLQQKTFTSGRWLWVGGTDWVKQPENFSGAYNCLSSDVDDWRSFGLLMNLAMCGTGTGAVLEPRCIEQLPIIRNQLNVTIVEEIGEVPPEERDSETSVYMHGNNVTIVVGDSRQGWVDSYQHLIELSSAERFDGQPVNVSVLLGNVRPAGEKLKGFGGVSNPAKLTELYGRCAAILNRAIGRQLNSLECCLLIDEAALTIVAGNIRRCIAYGERVSAFSGMKPIQDIAVGEMVLTSSGDYKPVTSKLVQGVQDVVEIRTRETSIRCTANHRVAVYNGFQSYIWKNAGELQPGDRLISVPHHKGMPCSTADYAWLVGFFIGDGHADLESAKRRNGGGGSVTFAFPVERLNGLLGQKCLRILREMGYTPSIALYQNNGSIRVYRKNLAEELIQYKQPCGTPIIPEFVWMGTEEIRSAFLAGLADADGGSRNVLLNSNKIAFLRQVQQLSLSLGIATTLHERPPKMLQGRDTVYEGCHWLKIRGIQSQVNAVALLNPHMGRAEFRICGQRKNGLSLPYLFLQEAMADGWRSRTAISTKSIINPSQKGGDMRDANWDTLLAEGVVNPHWLPLEVQLVVPAGQAETFDIEVEGDHEFIASGLLVHNSAGIRQFASEDPLGETAKDNLWQQGEDGSWRIDPDRDALRMANHTRVYHTIPSLETIVASVTKQFYSGEGAIQYAPEAIVRASADLLRNRGDKEAFIRSYLKSPEEAKNLFLMMGVPEEEADDRLHRYGLNPCLAKGTIVKTGSGHYPIEELIGKTVFVWDNEEWVSVDNFRVTGTNQPIVKVIFSDGTFVRATPNHKFFLKNGESIEVKDLLPEMELLTDSTYPNQKIFVSQTIEDGIDDEVYCCTVPDTHRFALANGIVSGNCGEIIMRNNSCNLSEVHLNRLDPNDRAEQEDAFKAAAIWVSALLHHEFVEPRYQRSRELDPIVGVSFTGLFDFFVKAFGVDWLRWWQAGRSDDWNEASEEGKDLIADIANSFPDWHGYPLKTKSGTMYKDLERRYLEWWRSIVEETVAEYCDRHGLRTPNRCTTCQPSGCLTRDAVRVFDQGLLFADEHLEDGSGEVSLDEFHLSVRNGIPVRTGIANNVMGLLEVTLANGRQITMTPKHRLSIGSTWVAADQIKPGQIIDFELGNYRNAKEAHLEYIDIQMGLTGRQPRGCVLPTEMSPDLAYFIGALFGNGHCSESKYRIRFSHGSRAVLDKISQIGLSLFGLEGVLCAEKSGLNHEKSGTKYELCFANKQLYLWFIENQINKDCKSNKLNRIPQKVRMSSRRSILSFFTGLIDTDGCIRKDGSLSIDSASEQFMRHLQQIGEAVGLCFSFFANTKGENLQKGKAMFGLCLSRMLSSSDSIAFINTYSVKAKSRQIHPVSRTFKFDPYTVESIKVVEDYTFDYAVDGVNDDDSWYWQGALKSHNTKSLLTGASPGWHPPKAAWFIRRITFGKNDPVALACIDYGYTVIPSQSDKDEDGRLLDDPFDPRCTEWLVEIPTAVSWADIPGVEEVDISQFSALAQFDFYMQVQGHYVGHNASATIELRATEIEPLAKAIHTAIVADNGYISATLLARFDDLQTFPRLPFEPITKTEYNVLHEAVLKRRINPNFQAALAKYDRGENIAPAGCDSDKCLFPSK